MNFMRFLLLLIFYFFSSALLFADQNKSDLVNEISKNIRCLICQGQSVYDSQSDFAVSMKLVIEKKLNDGLSKDEIYEFLKEQYGEWISYSPEFNQNTLILWILPIIVFIVGGLLILINSKIFKL